MRDGGVNNRVWARYHSIGRVERGVGGAGNLVDRIGGAGPRLCNGSWVGEAVWG